MTEIGDIARLWERCVAHLDRIEARQHGKDNQLLMAELAQERSRLLAWGDAVGIADPSATSKPNKSLEKQVSRNIAMTDLGGIDNLFTSLPSSQDEYGIRPAREQKKKKFSLSSMLKKSSMHHQETSWEIHNITKFRDFVSMIRFHNEHLESLDYYTKIHNETLLELEEYCAKKYAGCLAVRAEVASLSTAPVRLFCQWEGNKQEFKWKELADSFTKSDHVALELYKKKGFIPLDRSDTELYGFRGPEAEVLLDVESYSIYEHVRPGTVTLAGFGMEMWDYEQKSSPKQIQIPVSNTNLGGAQFGQLLRRYDELQSNSTPLGLSPVETEEHDLEEFMGVPKSKPMMIGGLRDYGGQLPEFFGMLNRDLFVDFGGLATVSGAWINPNQQRTVWDILEQVIIAKELGRRLEKYETGSYKIGFTRKVLASVIVADQFMRHVAVELRELRLADIGVEIAELSEARRAQTENCNAMGDAAMLKSLYQDAYDLYTQAINMDGGNPIYRANRSGAALRLNRNDAAWTDAHIASRLDPKYTDAWCYYGQASLRRGLSKLAVQAYEKAIETAGSSATAILRQGLEGANAQVKEEKRLIDTEQNVKQKLVLQKRFLDQDWNAEMKELSFVSGIHGQQVDGLLLFGEMMKWPYLEEVRIVATEAYSKLFVKGNNTPVNLFDWLFGLVLPGQWMSFTIMTVLIQCTPSIKEDLITAAPRYDCGLSLPQVSYWRIRTALGRVLGAIPGIKSKCGWLGPCPPVEFIPTADDKPRHIFLDTRTIAPLPSIDPLLIDLNNSITYRFKDTYPDGGEDYEAYKPAIMNEENWSIPVPPTQQPSTCEMISIQLHKNPLVPSQGGADDISYRAQLVFKLTASGEMITYQLLTNPSFTALPQCCEGPHQIFTKEQYRYENVCTADKLKEYLPEQFDRRRVTIINATGQGAELLARAWCSERGKNAVIRVAGGACLVCAERAASVDGLGTGVLIWVS